VELKKNAFYNYSHRRLMGRAQADPGKRDPAEQEHEHEVIDKDFTSTRSVDRFEKPRLDRLLSWLPPVLHPTAKHMVRVARATVLKK